MESLHIAICEDNKKDTEVLVSMIDQIPIHTACTVYESGERLLDEFHPGKYDLIFMDIYMGKLSGIDTVTAIRKMDEQVFIVFVTVSTDFALESYRLDAIKYIEKPVREKYILEILELVRLKKDNQPKLTVSINKKVVSIPFDQILYTEQKGRKLLIYLNEGKTVQTNERLDKIEGVFHDHSFFRCHKSFLVNLSYITSIDKNLSTFVMKDGSNVHIRRESFKAAKEAYENFLFAKTRELNND